jgi:hypothetical protein
LCFLLEIQSICLNTYDIFYSVVFLKNSLCIDSLVVSSYLAYPYPLVSRAINFPATLSFHSRLIHLFFFLNMESCWTKFVLLPSSSFPYLEIYINSQILVKDIYMFYCMSQILTIASTATLPPYLQTLPNSLFGWLGDIAHIWTHSS